LWARGEAEAALAELQVAVRLNPELALARYQLALILDRLGRRPEAVRHMTRALALAPGNVEARQALERLTSQSPSPGAAPGSR
jgi:Flp pilus assembly protein TadD